jgi:hypothetical protein
MGLAPWGALGGGNFKTDEQRKSQDGRKMGEASQAAIKISKVLERIAKTHNAEITSVALAYVMQKTPYVFPIVGGRKLEHLKGNIAGLSIDLTETDMKDIEEANSFDIGFPMNFLGGPGALCLFLSNSLGLQDPSKVYGTLGPRACRAIPSFRFSPQNATLTVVSKIQMMSGSWPWLASNSMFRLPR